MVFFVRLGVSVRDRSCVGREGICLTISRKCKFGSGNAGAACK